MKLETYYEMFCGIGGFGSALNKFGFKCVGACDKWITARKDYMLNFPGVEVAGDSTRIHTERFPKADILAAGFPCQPFSIQGKHRGMLGEDGMLFYECVRYMALYRPTYVILENVPNILKVNAGKDYNSMMSDVKRIKYQVKTYILNAKDYGTPQNRERIYVVCLNKSGHRGGDTVGYFLKEDETWIETLKETAPLRVVDDILESPESEAAQKLYLNKEDQDSFRRKKEDLTEPVRELYCVGYIRGKANSWNRVYDTKGVAPTQTATTGGAGGPTGLYMIKGKGIRPLTINEMRRLMGFPDSHAITYKKQLGNAVIPQMIEMVVKNTLTRMDGFRD